MLIEKKESLIKNKHYLFLISAQLISSLGDWIDILALMTLVGLKWEASPLEMSVAMLCLTGPMILLGPFAGVLADRYDRKKIMIISDIIRCFIVIGVIFATALWHIYILLFLKSIFAALFVPAKNGKLKEIVPDEHMQQAMGISAMIDNGSKIVGPMISGVLVSVLGVYGAFYLDAVTFIISALLLIGVGRGKVMEEKEEKDSFNLKKQLVDGFQHIKHIPIFFFGLLIVCLSLLVLQIADTQIIVLARLMNGTADQITDIVGYSMAASGAGMFLVSAILSKKEMKSLAVSLSLGAVILGVAIGGQAFIIDLQIEWLYYLFPAFMFCAGASFGLIIVPFNIGAQKATPVNLTGRVFGTINSMTTLAAIIGVLLGGFLAEVFGVVTAFAISGCLLLTVGGCTIIAKSVLERRDPFAEGVAGVQGETST